MYFAAFGRLGSTQEISSHVTSGRPRAQTVDAFLNSAEFNDGAKFVAGLYVGILGRDAEYGGWLFQRNAMARWGATPHGLVDNFLNSAEFNQKNPNLSDANFVRLIYRQVLGREATPEEVTFQTTHLTSRVNLAVAFLASPEFRNRVGPRLTGFLVYALLMEQDPSKQALDYAAEQFAAGVPVMTKIEALWTSVTY